jgi:flagellar basal body rod protein FlgG
MFLSASLSDALDRIADRASDVRRAFVPGARPENGDVASGGAPPEFTLDPLSVAAPDGAYFVLSNAGRTVYSQDGSFTVRDGVLTDERGDAVLGIRSPGDPLEAVRVDPVDAALGRFADVRIDEDGTLSYSRVTIDPRTGTRGTRRVAAGRIALARFPAGTKLAGGSVFGAPAGIVPHTGVPGDGAFDRVTPNRRARSGVDLDVSLARLKDAYVAFDALQAAESAKGRLGKTAMDLLK